MIVWKNLPHCALTYITLEMFKGKSVPVLNQAPFHEDILEGVDVQLHTF